MSDNFQNFRNGINLGSLALDPSDPNVRNGDIYYSPVLNTFRGYINGVWVDIPGSGGSFSNPMTTTGDMIYSDPGSNPVRIGIGSLGQVLSSNGTIPVWSNLPGATAFSIGASSPITTTGSISGSPGTWQTFPNSPAFIFTPIISGTYKVYSPLPLTPGPGDNVSFFGRIVNTFGGATLLQESQVLAIGFKAGVTDPGFSGTAQSVYNLTAGTTYQFDIQGQVESSGTLTLGGPVFYMFLEGVGLNGVLNTSASSYAMYTSNIVNTISSPVTSVTPTFTTFSNSPAFTFTPNVTGTYKVYTSVPLETNTAAQEALTQIINTSGGAVLLSQSQATAYSDSPATVDSVFIQNTYGLTAGTTYVFDIQGSMTGSGSAFIRGDVASFYMYAEGVGLNNNTAQFPVAFKAFAGANFAAVNTTIVMPSPNIIFDTNSGYNPSTGVYTVPYAGFYVVGFSGQTYAGGQIVYIEVDGVFQGYITDSSGQNGDIWGVSTLVKCNAGSQITWWNQGSTDFNTNTWISVYSQTLAQGLVGPQGSSTGSSFAYYASSAVTNQSTAISSGTFETFDNSPALTFTPTVSGVYKVYGSIPLGNLPAGDIANVRVWNTSGGATLLQESQAGLYGQSSSPISNEFAQSVYSLNAGTTYVFDVQGKVTGGSVQLDATEAGTFYMFAEGVGLATAGTNTLASQVGTITTKFGVDPATGSTSLATTGGSPIPFPYVYYDTTNSYNAVSYTYTAPVAGYYDIQLTSFYDATSQTDTFVVVNGINKAGRVTMNTAAYGTMSGSTQVYLNYGDVLTIEPDSSSSLGFAALTNTPSGYIPTVTISLRPPTPAVTSRIVKSNSSGVFAFSSSLVQVTDGVNPISATVICNGGDVEIGMMADGTDNESCIFIDSITASDAFLYFYRDGVRVSNNFMQMQTNLTYNLLAIPPGGFRFIDTPPPGSHTYTVWVVGGPNRGDQQVGYSVIYARPLA